jgi:hypothetical protein
MLPIFASSGGKKKPKKKRGKGKAPEPKTITSLGASKTPQQQQQQRRVSEKVFTDEDQHEDMPIKIVEGLVGKAFISAIEGHLAKLYSKIDNLKTEVSTLKTIVGSLVEENKKLGEVGRHAPDPEIRQTTTPLTPTQELTIRPRPQ